MDVSGETVVIPLKRLKELEALEEYNKKRLEQVRKYNKEHPEEHRKTSLQTYHKNKEAINEKRRAAYKAKKEAEAAAKAQS